MRKQLRTRTPSKGICLECRQLKVSNRTVHAKCYVRETAVNDVIFASRKQLIVASHVLTIFPNSSRALFLANCRRFAKFDPRENEVVYNTQNN